MHCAAFALQKFTTPGDSGVLPCTTVPVRVMVAPGFTGLLGRIAKLVEVAACTGGVTVVTSLAVSFEVLVSPPPDTAAVFLIEAAAELLTFTVRVIERPTLRTTQ